MLRVFVVASGCGVNVDQCADISRGLSWLLDTQNIIPDGRYNLEVSSPGLERQLKEKWHFEGAVQEVVKFHLIRPLNIPEDIGEKMTRRMGQVKRLKGMIVEVLDNRVVVESDGLCWEVLFDNIQKAQVVFDFKKAIQGKPP